jgi:hypothetical protein
MKAYGVVVDTSTQTHIVNVDIQPIYPREISRCAHRIRLTDLRAVMDGLEDRTLSFACQGIDCAAGRLVAVPTTLFRPSVCGAIKFRTFFSFQTEALVQFMTIYGIILSHGGVEKLIH